MKQLLAICMMVLVLGASPLIAVAKTYEPSKMKITEAERQPTSPPFETQQGKESKEGLVGYDVVDAKEIDPEDITKRHEKIKKRLAEKTLTIAVGEVKEFVVKGYEGDRKKIQVALTNIHGKETAQQDMYPLKESAGKQKSLLQAAQIQAPQQKQTYCANFVVITEGKEQKPTATAAAPVMKSNEAAQEKEPLQKSVFSFADTITEQQDQEDNEGIYEEDQPTTAPSQPIMSAPIPEEKTLISSPPLESMSNQELCLTEEDTGFLVWVYDIDEQRQQVQFALYTDEGNIQEKSLPEYKQFLPAAAPMRTDGEEVQQAVQRTPVQEEGICRVNGDTIEVGTRFVSEGQAFYCDEQGDIQLQKEAGESAAEEYECQSTRAADGQCVEKRRSFLRRILSLLGLR